MTVSHTPDEGDTPHGGADQQSATAPEQQPAAAEQPSASPEQPAPAAPDAEHATHVMPATGAPTFHAPAQPGHGGAPAAFGQASWGAFPQPSSWGQQPSQQPPAQPGYGATPAGFGQPSGGGLPQQPLVQDQRGPSYGPSQPPAQHGYGYGAAPTFGAPASQQPAFTAGGTGAPPGSGGPPQGQQGSSAKAIVLAVVGGLILLALLVFGAWRIFSGAGGDPDGDAANGTEIATEADTGAAATGCTNDVCLQTAAQVGEQHTANDGAVWALQGSWIDVDSGDSRQLGGGSGVYASEIGEATLTAVAFETAEHAADYAAAMMADLGDAHFTGPVWDGAVEGRGEGVLNQFEADGVETLVWYDDAGIVCTLVGPFADVEEDPLFEFYFTLPEI